MLTKETTKGQFAETLNYQNDTKIRRKLAYEMYSCVQLLGASPPDPLTRDAAPGPHWGTAPRPPL